MKRFDLFFVFIRLPFDYLALLLAGATAYFIRLSDFFISFRKVQIGLSFETYAHATVLIALVWLFIFALVGLYSSDSSRKFGTELNRIFAGATIGLAAVAIIIFLRGELFNSRFIVLAVWGIAIIYVAIGRLCIRLFQYWLYTLGIGQREVVIVGDNEIATQLINEFHTQKHLGVAVVKHISKWNDTAVKQLIPFFKTHHVEEMIITSPVHQTETLAALAFAGEHHLTFTYSADLFATYAPNRRMSVVGEIPLVEHKPTRLDGWGRIIKRLFDIVGALLALIIFSPFLIMVALCILVETGHPIFFKNERVGQQGNLFNVLKFRTMYQKDSIGTQFKNSKHALAFEEKLKSISNSKEGPVYKIKNDPRITPLGRFLRKWSLDELPNFFNVLFGTMSLVGPRPHQPREVAQYAPHHRKVLAIKPGITGLAQISGRSELSFEKEVQLDTYYIEHWSLTMDLFILLKTPFSVLTKRGSIT